MSNTEKLWVECQDLRAQALEHIRLCMGRSLPEQYEEHLTQAYLLLRDLRESIGILGEIAAGAEFDTYNN